MAKLHRFVKLKDKPNTHIFTFLIPTNIGSNSSKEVISTEFSCAHQKWSILLSKQENDTHIGAFLTLKDPTPGIYVTADFGFSMLNRLHYTRNETFVDNGKVFSKQQPVQGRKSFITVNDIKSSTKGFIMEKDQLCLEVSLSNLHTRFEYQLQLPLSEKDKQKCQQNDMRLETGHFPFGGSEWQVSLKINDKLPADTRGGGSIVSIRRLTNFTHYCKFSYRIHVGVIEPTPLPGAKPLPTSKISQAKVGPFNKSAKPVISNNMDSLFIEGDTQDKLVIPHNVYKLATTQGVITIKIECFNCILLTLLQIPMGTSRNKALQCYDRDRQTWFFEPHMRSDKLRFFLFYGSIRIVPRGCFRMVEIGVSVLPAYGKCTKVEAINSPYTKYYVQHDQDDFGLEILTPIPMKDLIDPKNAYVYDNTSCLTVQIEWGDSHLLKDVEYSLIDNVSRLHKLQMSREMANLERENLTLEKEMHSYHTTIAQKVSKGEYDPNIMAPRPQPPGQAQPGYGETQLDRLHGITPQDQLHRGMNMTSNQINSNPMNQLSTPYSQHSNLGSGMVSQNHTNYDAGYSRNELGVADAYERQSRGYGGMDSMPVPADRGHRSRSADPSGSHYYPSPVVDRRAGNRRNSTTGAEYADLLEQTPNNRYNRGMYSNTSGYQSDSGYPMEATEKGGEGRYNGHYTQGSGRPRPSTRSSKPSDSRSDHGDYFSESRTKASYDRDLNVYGYNKFGGKHSIGNAGVRPQMANDGRRSMLSSATPTGRASYAGYETEYIPSESGRTGASYPSTPRSTSIQRGGGYPRGIENGPR